MRKLVLLMILGIAATMVSDDTRRTVKMLTRPLWLPLVEWNAREQMRQVARDVVAEEAKTGTLPEKRRWLPWLEYRYAAKGMKRDPWGSPYHLEVWADSVAVLSFGPDRTRHTDDDFRVTVRRQGAGR